jgi:uncharacterized protein
MLPREDRTCLQKIVLIEKRCPGDKMVMVKSGDLSIRLYELLRDQAKMRTIADVRLGRAYIAVRLDDGRLGLSGFPTHCAGLPALLGSSYDDSCCPGLSDVPTTEPSRGEAISPPSVTLTGSATVLGWLTEKGTPLKKALALATANALIRQDHSDMGGDSLDLFHLTHKDKVVMVGRFTPLVDRIESTGASLTVLEKDAAKGLVLSKGERRTILKNCTVAILTATALLYDDLENILNDLSAAPRHVALLGPSTPMLPALFADTPVTHLGGVRIIEAAQILPIVSAGGGTRAMRPYLEMTNLFLRKSPHCGDPFLDKKE